MNTYEKAKQLGYTDEQIVEHFSKKDPKFKEKYDRGIQLGFKPQQIFDKAQNSYKNNKNIPSAPKESKNNNTNFLKDADTQTAQGLGIGALGTYGDVLQFLGLQGQEQPETEKAKFGREFESLEKMRQPGKPEFSETFSNLSELSEEDFPRLSRLPTSKDIEEIGKKGGLVTEPKTMAGRYGKRIGKTIGAFSVTGAKPFLVGTAAGVAGQTLEELGAPPWAQAAGEVIASLGVGIGQGVRRAVSSDSPKVQNTIESLRKSGFSEQDITLAKNALESRGILKKVAQPSQASEKIFKDTIQNTEQNFNKILESSFPNLNKEGPEFFKDLSSNIFNSMDEMAQKVPVSLSANFAGDLLRIKKGLQRTLAETPQESQVIKYIDEAIESVRPKFKGGRPATPETPSNIVDEFGKPFMKPGKEAIPAKKMPALTADYYLRFYRGLNSIGRWENPKQREFVFTHMKNAIKNVLQHQGEKGIEIANNLEKANKSWIKYLQAEDISDLLKKSATDEGINFTKLSKLLENGKNFDVLKQGLGTEKSGKLKLIADIGKEIKGLDKELTGSQAKQFFGSMKAWEFTKSLLTLNMDNMAALGGSALAGKTATKFLTEEKYQNLWLKMAQLAREKKWQQLSQISQNLQNDLSDQGKKSK